MSNSILFKLEFGSIAFIVIFFALLIPNKIIGIFLIAIFIIMALIMFHFKNSKVINSNNDESRYIPSNVKQEVWERDGGKCVLCGSRKHLEYDHNIPVSKGGSNTVKNIQLLCKNCNRKKSGRIE
jgi:hypothetical protein